MEDEVKVKRGSVYDVDLCPPNRKVCKRYKNFKVEGTTDGKFKEIECEPVSPSLAAEYSVDMNALRSGKEKPLRGRINVDAVDLLDNINPLSK